MCINWDSATIYIDLKCRRKKFEVLTGSSTVGINNVEISSHKIMSKLYTHKYPQYFRCQSFSILPSVRSENLSMVCQIIIYTDG